MIFRTTGVLPGSIPGSAVKVPANAGDVMKSPQNEGALAQNALMPDNKGHEGNL